MPIDFYYFAASPPCRMVILLAKAIGVHLNLKTVNVLKGDQMKPDFLKLNPQHVIPTMDDGGFILCESRPIMGYLVSKYAKNDALYPKDPKMRGLVDQMLYFDIGTLNENMTKCYFPVVFFGAHSINEADLQAVERSFEILNSFIDGREFVAGDTLTIADIAISTTITFPIHIKMPIDFYQLPGSAPCRAVALAAAAIGVEMNLKEVVLMNGEHLKPEYLKMNPQHTIPTIDDNGFYLWESRAIMTYLADQYGKNDSLYPKDPKKRALVNSKLYFDACTLYKAFADCYYPIFFAKEPKNPAKVSSLDAALSFLDKFLEGRDYVAGKNMTLADLSIVSTVSTVEVVGHDIKAHKNIARWYAKIKSEAPKYDQINKAGVEAFKAFIDEMMKK
ncbi:PREDICTED: glutathione S-transferase 1-like [Habropoda laboriosa]|uniref:glutathione S-transferase 1-like n=1 Tax=Habropoda laboriosa TaxID=597456 RepID=UPI00083CF0B3|nr:PREDICTED: glutathione S-transferase 1-like [Habropoda laboriosa]